VFECGLLGLNAIWSLIIIAFTIVVILSFKDKSFWFLKSIWLFVAIVPFLFFVIYPTRLAWLVKKALKANSTSI